jgi:hypothetical protein
MTLRLLYPDSSPRTRPCGSTLNGAQNLQYCFILENLVDIIAVESTLPFANIIFPIEMAQVPRRKECCNENVIKPSLMMTHRSGTI